MRLELEWHVPWPVDWSSQKKVAAADKLVKYLERGTFYETVRRMQCVQAKRLGTEKNPIITLILEV